MWGEGYVEIFYVLCGGGALSCFIQSLADCLQRADGALAQEENVEDNEGRKNPACFLTWMFCIVPVCTDSTFNLSTQGKKDLK